MPSILRKKGVSARTIYFVVSSDVVHYLNEKDDICRTSIDNILEISESVDCYTIPLFSFIKRVLPSIDVEKHKIHIASPFILKHVGSLQDMLVLLPSLHISPLAGGYAKLTNTTRSLLLNQEHVSKLQSFAASTDDPIIKTLIEDCKFFHHISASHLIVVIGDIVDPRWFCTNGISHRPLFKYFGLTKGLELSIDIELRQQWLFSCWVDPLFIDRLKRNINRWSSNRPMDDMGIFSSARYLLYQKWFDAFFEKKVSLMSAIKIASGSLLRFIFYRWLSLLYPTVSSEFFSMKDFFDEEFISEFNQWNQSKSM